MGPCPPQARSRIVSSDSYGQTPSGFRDVSGDRIHNLTAFTDPMMKSFVRFMNNLDQTDLMPEAPSHGEDGAPIEETALRERASS